MKKMKLALVLSVALVGLVAQPILAAVTPDEAAKLKTELTPFGAEKAGNKEGTIPAWDGGFKPGNAFGPDGRRTDPFADEKPLYSISAKNMDQYADKLSEGVKAMMKKYPDYRIDVYPTHRTATAPQWVYDATFKNATSAKTTPNGEKLEGARAGIPFPIAKSALELMWNRILYWRGVAWQFRVDQYLITSAGKNVLSTVGDADQQMPYYNTSIPNDKWDGGYWFIRLVNAGPPIRAGEAVVGRQNVDWDKTQSWVYLTGQRRVRKLPESCCDTPTPATAGVMTFDELEGFDGRIDRMDWKLVGKKEMYVPYNSNRTAVPKKDADVISGHFLNPDHVRWELHRVYVIEASIKPGKRHQTPKSRYYMDEDTYMVLLGDRWDGNNQLWKYIWYIPHVQPDVPATAGLEFGYYDLLSGAGYASNLYNESKVQYKMVAPQKDSVFTPESMAGEGVR